MIFNSLQYIFFLIGVIIFYYLLPNNILRKYFLLIISLLFYSFWSEAFLLLLLFELGVSYFAGLSYYRSKEKNSKTIPLFIFVLVLLLPLLVFKYLNFIISTIIDVGAIFGFQQSFSSLNIIVPIGVSFYTFMAISYVVDVYKERIPIEKDFLDYSLYLCFFPQIASGPISRASLVLPQFKSKKGLSYDNLMGGTRLIIWGLFLKVVVGDRAGIYVDTVFRNYENSTGSSLILATFLYTIQIYCDFAGYSTIAIGSAKALGYDLMNNFNRPYFAVSISDFWRRWHISLSTWFRDYVYIPLGGSRCGSWKIYRNLFITFLISGLWHGAAYTFVLWGAYHGLLQIIERAIHWKSLLEKNKWMKPISILITFVLVAYGWLIFYAPDMSMVCSVTKNFFNIGEPYFHLTTIFYVIIGIIILFLFELKEEFFPKTQWLLTSKHMVIRYLSWVTLVMIIILCGAFGGGQFIYFKF